MHLLAPLTELFLSLFLQFINPILDSKPQEKSHEVKAAGQLLNVSARATSSSQMNKWQRTGQCATRCCLLPGNGWKSHAAL